MLRALPALLAPVLAALLAACASMPQAAAAPHPEARAYTADVDANADVDAALARSAVSGKRVLLVMGANWCHDSRALAGWLETPRFAALVAERYELVFVDVGMPQTGEGRNLDIARRFGLAELKNTPALLVLSPDGRALNTETASDWRDAASRSEEAIYAELAALAEAPIPAARSLMVMQDGTRGADLVVWVGGDETSCRYALSPDGPWLESISELPGLMEARSIHVRSGNQAKWRCVASDIFRLQKLGATVGFVSDPAN